MIQPGLPWAHRDITEQACESNVAHECIGKVSLLENPFREPEGLIFGTQSDTEADLFLRYGVQLKHDIAESV